MYQVIAVLFFLAACSFDSHAEPILDPAEFDSARQLSEKDKESNVAAGGCYMTCELDPYYETQFPQMMRDCFRSVAAPVIESFEAILAINAEGDVQDLWLDLDTNLSRCASAAMEELNFPKPPFSPYHARITTNLK